MKILSIHNGHDASAAIYDNFKQIAIYKEERLSRIKQDGAKLPVLSLEKLREKVDFSSIDAMVLSKTIFDPKYIKFPWYKKMEYELQDKKVALNSLLTKKYKKGKIVNALELFNKKEFKRDLGLSDRCDIYFYNHHFAHILPTLFYNKKWENALLYSADGGGDFGYYGIYYFDGQNILPIFEDKYIKKQMMNSLGLMYSAVTEAIGFKPNRHEGKITGLAAFGKNSMAVDEIKDKFFVDNDGIIQGRLKNYKKEFKPFIVNLLKKVSKEDLAYAAQKVLEEIMIESIVKIKKNYNFTNIGLSGGVFANVKLNQRISELTFIDDMFVFPPMGDEGLVIGGVMEYLIKIDGIEKFLSNRKEFMEIPYWGDSYNVNESDLPDWAKVIAKDNIVANSVELLKNKKICALFTKSMEYGPRALGARSILIDPTDKSINSKVNKRLNRTEFMPFAPYVRLERVEEIFSFPKSSLKAMRYMTVTCDVNENWKDKIQATVHVDGTARPQTITQDENRLYYDILFEYEKRTGIPCLVNTSFNAHEEPIINTFNEALQALKNDRVDYIITENFIIGKR